MRISDWSSDVCSSDLTLPLGTYAVVSGLEPTASDNDLPPGVIFCLRAVGDAAAHAAEPGYPLSPNFVVHVGDEGEVLLPYTQAKQVLDRLKKTAIGRDFPDAEDCARFDTDKRLGRDLASYQTLLARAVASLAGRSSDMNTTSVVP